MPLFKVLYRSPIFGSALLFVVALITVLFAYAALSLGMPLSTFAVSVFLCGMCFAFSMMSLIIGIADRNKNDETHNK